MQIRRLVMRIRPQAVQPVLRRLMLPSMMPAVQVPARVVPIAHRPQHLAMPVLQVLAQAKQDLMHRRQVQVLAKLMTMQAAPTVLQVPLHRLLPTTQVIVGSSLMQARLPAPQVPQTARLVTPIASHRLLPLQQVMPVIKQASLRAPMLKQVAQPKMLIVHPVPHPVPRRMVTAVLPVPSLVPQVLPRAVPRVPRVKQAMPQVLQPLMIR